MQFPLFLFEYDGWPVVIAAREEIADAYEPGWWDDVAHAFDQEGRPLAFDHQNGRIVQVASEPETSKLEELGRSAIARFSPRHGRRKLQDDGDAFDELSLDAVLDRLVEGFSR